MRVRASARVILGSMIAVLGALSYAILCVGSMGTPAHESLGGLICDDAQPTGRTAVVEGIEFIEISPGHFRMGSSVHGKPSDLLGRLGATIGIPLGSAGTLSTEMPVHRVCFSYGFWVARYEVTNAAYEKYAGRRNRSEFSEADEGPVVELSWVDAMAWCAWLAGESGIPIRLPNEAEWEAVCRAGRTCEYSFGDKERSLGAYGWYSGNSDFTAQRVGERIPNRWGFFDLHGNVREWCRDVYRPDYSDSTGSHGLYLSSVVPERRVTRGGGWQSAPVNCRCASRTWSYFTERAALVDVGFRPAFSLQNGLEGVVLPYLSEPD